MPFGDVLQSAAIAVLKRLGGKLGMNRDPHIVLGPLWADSTDRRAAYHQLHNVRCENQSHAIWFGKRIKPRTVDCRATIRFERASGERDIIECDALITDGPTSKPIMPLFADKPVNVHVYLDADGSISHPVLRGQPLARGYYVTGAEFLHFGEVRRSWSLRPGTWILTVSLIWDGGSSPPYSTEVIVPS